ncbi:MAG: hypothetical protein U5J78_02070 [Parasphingorhabdus sp.]|nr:hypothetical protein [Parasphingorhabdus sp.]
MAKSQKKSNKEVRKPKAEKKKTDVVQPSRNWRCMPGLNNSKANHSA